ncbi:MAG: aminotransferase class III-fold pyridoxal phosphate-dependent enzyme, partial [Coriobacteriia bacterium]|nr:aminotransferase class III-fold pyridoxal phosphate-dependent enzyme [Coriobacteriia bacterium]
LPVGAYGGRREIMQMVSPSGGVYQAGTLSGNPIAMAAGLAQLEQLEDQGVYEQISRLGQRLAQGLSDICISLGLPCCVTNIGSLATLFFGVGSAKDYATVSRADTGQYASYFLKSLDAGVYLAPSQFEAMFVSAAHSDDDIDETLNVAEDALKQLSGR